MLSTGLISNDISQITNIGAVPIGDGKTQFFFVDSLGRMAMSTDLADATQPATSAQLDLQSVTRGFLIPRLTTVQRNGIASPATFLILANTTTGFLEVFNGATWVPFGGGTGGGWIVGGNTLNADIGIIGSLDAQPFRLYTNNIERMRIAASGLVGIGTTTPSQMLTVFAPGNNTGGVNITNANAGANAAAQLELSASARTYSVQVTSGANAVPNAYIVQDETASANRTILLSSGFFGIGPNVPVQLFHVAGSVVGLVAAEVQNLSANAAARTQVILAADTRTWALQAMPSASTPANTLQVVDVSAAVAQFEFITGVATNSGPTAMPLGTGAGQTGRVLLQELLASGVNVTGFRAPDTLAADVLYALPTADATLANKSLTSDGAGNLSWQNAIQSGTASLTNGVSAAIPANIATGSRIFVQAADTVPGAGNLTIGYRPLAAGRVNGTPGSFTITAVLAVGTINTLDQSVGLMWMVLNP